MAVTEKLGTIKERKVLLQKVPSETCWMVKEKRQRWVQQKSRCDENLRKWSIIKKDEEKARPWLHWHSEQTEV